MCNGKMYIGKTTYSLNKRKREHFRLCNKGKGLVLYNAFRKYGFDNFSWNVIDTADSNEELNSKEKFWIRFYNTFIKNDCCNGYNMTIGGDGLGRGELHPQYNKEFTDEHKKKIKENHADFSGKNNPMYGRKQSSEAKAKASESKKGKKNPNYGKTISKETKEKIRIANSGANNINSRPVIQLTLDDRFIAEFANASEGAKAVDGLRQSVMKCCKGVIKTHRNFKWIYKDNYKGD